MGGDDVEPGCLQTATAGFCQSRPSPDLPPKGGGSCKDLAELLAEGFGGLVLLATDFDEPFHAGLELVVVGARGTAFQVELQLQHLGVAELPIQIAVELLTTVTPIHCWSPPSCRWRARYRIRPRTHRGTSAAAAGPGAAGT